MASFTAAGTAYANRGVPMVPFFIFYSMFGFQRVGDLIWAAADARAEGFLLGATAGRTTLTGEGLQHQDGHSHCCWRPPCRRSRPTTRRSPTRWPSIVEPGSTACTGPRTPTINVTSSTTSPSTTRTTRCRPCPTATVPTTPDRVGVIEAVPVAPAPEGGQPRPPSCSRARAHGAAAAARDELAERWDVGVELWSATSYKELREEAPAQSSAGTGCTPTTSPARPWSHDRLAIGATPSAGRRRHRLHESVPDQIARWVPAVRFTSLGTDGFGRSDTRAALRRFFEIDAAHVVVAVLAALAERGGGSSPRSWPTPSTRHEHRPRRAPPRHRWTAPTRPGSVRAMAAPTMPVTGNPEADRLLVEDPLALLLGMLLDQQVPMEWAFKGPLTPPASASAATRRRRRSPPWTPDDFVERFRAKPALHRFPRSMARAHPRAVHRSSSSTTTATPTKIWTGVRRAQVVHDRLRELPGYGEEKAKIFLAILAKRFGIEPDGWEAAAAPFSDDVPRSVADISSEEALPEVREWKKAQKAKGKCKQRAESSRLAGRASPLELLALRGTPEVSEANGSGGAGDGRVALAVEPPEQDRHRPRVVAQPVAGAVDDVAARPRRGHRPARVRRRRERGRRPSRAPRAAAAGPGAARPSTALTSRSSRDQPSIAAADGCARVMPTSRACSKRRFGLPAQSSKSAGAASAATPLISTRRRPRTRPGRRRCRTPPATPR